MNSSASCALWETLLRPSSPREREKGSHETHLVAERRAQTDKVLVPRNGAGTEASGVVADELDVEQLKAALAQVFDQADQRHLRGIAPAREHRLSGEHFEAVGVTAGVQLLVGVDHCRRDPAAVAWPVGTAADDLAEGAIDRVPEAA